MASHNDLGKKGEALAEKFLRANGYEVLVSNYRFEKAEIDLIAKKDNILIVVEVKTRSSAYFGFPEEFVTEKKEQLISDAIDDYLEKENLDLPIRFDIISIILQKNKNPEIMHFKDAFNA